MSHSKRHAMDPVKAYIIPFSLDTRIAQGSEGYPLKGPIIFVPELRTAIFYELSVMGDAENSTKAYALERDATLLGQLEKQMRGEPLGHPYEGEQFNLSRGVVEVMFSEIQEVGALCSRLRWAVIAYDYTKIFEHVTREIARDLEQRVGSPK